MTFVDDDVDDDKTVDTRRSSSEVFFERNHFNPTSTSAVAMSEVQKDDNSSTAPSTTAEHKTVGVQFQIISEIVDNIPAYEDQKRVD